MTALTWVGNERFRGEYSFCAATVFALIVARLGVQISRADHIPAKQNVDTDGLSRGRSVRDVLGAGVDDWAPDGDPLVFELKSLCDPLEFEARCADFDTFGNPLLTSYLPPLPLISLTAYSYSRDPPSRVRARRGGKRRGTE